MKKRLFALICSAAFLGASCAGSQLPDENYAPGQTVAAAQERQYQDNPQAKLHLKLAQDQMREAQKYRKEGEEDLARMMLMRAQADADYALGLLRREDAIAEARDVQERLRELRSDLDAGVQTPGETDIGQEE